MSDCCTEDGCRRQYPISLYRADFSGQVYAVTKRRLVGERGDGTATFAATRRHEVTEQMMEFIRRNEAWVREQLEASGG
jgi:hypothetical protein